ncbi:related to the plant PR-1 class of pathogen related proteins [Rhynchosporium secalis]|uniref:Related to the plant PR-1 class of pathogen related proteins n=1 Tax=Rhynchosporium secalis TaxID=38038 RepID=A0A1E1M190_RHYSE|nr:related to the plant PR-1 class of pathogen related proteins [Rhynchosporium secalis]
MFPSSSSSSSSSLTSLALPLLLLLPLTTAQSPPSPPSPASPPSQQTTTTSTTIRASPTPKPDPKTPSSKDSDPNASFKDKDIFARDILDAHNFYRNEHGVPDLSWNESSAELAGRWVRGCRFVHSGGPTGENLAAGYPNATASVDAWGLERKDYDFKKPGFGEKTGHFTQLVWGNSTSVGCAVKACGGENDTPGYFVVCEYYPPGNVVGSKNQAFKDNVPAQEKGKKTDTVESGIGAKSGAVRNGLNAGGALVMGLMMAVGFGAWEL